MFSLKISTLLVLLATLAFAVRFKECLRAPLDSFVPIADDCRSFIHCTDEDSSLKYTCSYDTYFNAESGKCEIDIHQVCVNDNSEIEKVVLQDNTTPITTAQPYSSTVYEHFNNTTSKPNCSPNDNSFYPHFTRCEYYYKCMGGYLTISRCSFNYAWDYKKEMCVSYDTVECVEGSKLSLRKPKL